MTTPNQEQRIAAQQRPHGCQIMRQRWSHLLFLHWPIDPKEIAKRLPQGLHVDIYDGKAWIGVVPFFMQRVRPLGLPPLPWLSWFLELNVRTYVHDDFGNPGVWFFSLDCNQPIAVEVARRFFHLPYEHSRMKAEISEHHVHYKSIRRGDSREAIFDYQLPTKPKPAVLGSLDWFLVERYALFSADSNRELHVGRVHHEPYQIEAISSGQWSALPIELDGIPIPLGPPISQLSAAILDVELFPLRRINGASV